MGELGVGIAEEDAVGSRAEVSDVLHGSSEEQQEMAKNLLAGYCPECCRHFTGSQEGTKLKQ